MALVNEKLLDDLARVGWHVLGVEGNATTPNVAHTVGLWKHFGHPELVMVGLGADTLVQLVRDVGGRVASGAKLYRTVTLDDVLTGHSVKFEVVLPVAHERFLPGAHEYYGAAGFAALQCFWPDRDGRFPDDVDVDPDCATVQPRLGDPEWTALYAQWPFEDSYVMASFTTRPVLEGSEPIRLVTHDQGDGSWQFLCGTTTATEDCCLIALQAALKIDPSVRELADLPPGWEARRDAPGTAWVRRRRE